MVRIDALDRLLAISQLLDADLRAWLTEHGLTTARVHLLWIVAQRGALTQGQLAEALDVTPRNVTGLVDALVESGHVTRSTHPTDRRALHITLTEEGEAFTAQVRRSHETLADQLFGHFSASELEALTTRLDDVLARLEALVHPPPGGTTAGARR